MEFTPEPLESLKSRYADALFITYVADENMVDRPGMHREHVFDGDDGLRLIISKEIHPNLGEVLHVTGSHFGSKAVELIRRSGVKNTDECEIMYAKIFEDKFRSISGDLRPMQFQGILGKKGIPHWIIK